MTGGELQRRVYIRPLWLQASLPESLLHVQRLVWGAVVSGRDGGQSLITTEPFPLNIHPVEHTEPGITSRTEPGYIESGVVGPGRVSGHKEPP